MSSEMELTEAGRLRLADLIEREKTRPIVEIPPKVRPLWEVVAALSRARR